MTTHGAGAVPPPASPLVVEHLPIADLHPDPGNPRRIAEDELVALTRSIATFGVVDPVLARRADRRVIAGHQRLVAARRAGLTTVPVILLDVTAADACLLNVALNRIGGAWDQDLLARLLIDLRATADCDLTLSGFAEADLGDLLTRFDQQEKRARPERFDLEDALAAYDRDATGIVPGAGWQLGAHRLFQGDATDAAFVARCLGGPREQSAEAGGGRSGAGQRDGAGRRSGKLLSPAKRRRATSYRTDQYAVSERRAGQVTGQARATQRYVPRPSPDEPALIARSVALATRCGRYGYRRITALLRQEGWRVNHKRVERLWRQEGREARRRPTGRPGSLR